MGWYQNYLNNVAQTPDEKYRGDMQAFVNSTWDNTTLKTSVEKETEIGSFEFMCVEAWKSTISEFTINFVKNSKDYRKLMFKDVTYNVDRGLYFRFDDNYWIVYDPTDNETTLSQVSVRRCNNNLKWIDRDSGEIYEVPCVVDGEVSSPTPKVNKNITLPNGHIVLQVQKNSKTEKIRKNQRFLLNGDPYKFVSYNAQMQSNYINNDVPILFMDLYLDEVHEGRDDMVNNIADRFSIDYTVEILHNDFEQVSGFSGDLSACVRLNGDVVDKAVKWQSMNGNATINADGQYTLTGIVGSQAIIRAYMSDNDAVYDEVIIEIKESLVAQNEIVISPVHNEVSQGETIEFTAYLYSNGERQTDVVQVSATGVDPTAYKLAVVGHNISLTGVKISSVPLRLTFTGGGTEKVLEVYLKSLF